MAKDNTKSPYGDDHVWPKTLYQEMRDMSAVAFIVYSFAYIVDVSRKAKEDNENFVGLEVDFEKDKSVTRSGVSDASLARSFTPTEVKELIEANEGILAKHYQVFRGSKLDGLKSALDILIERAKESGLERPLTLEEFDDLYQTQECVYGICRDSSNKRITIVFRGTENKLAFGSNWYSNISIAKKTVDLPGALKGTMEGVDNLKLHTGFYDYLFSKTVDKNDEEGTRKYDQIMGDLRALLAKYPDHKIYVTGHSLGGALSGMASIFLACEPDLPKPISCINFASPRLGNWDTFKAVNYLEKTKNLRVLRTVNENDWVTTIPSIGYWHFGFQVDLYKKGWFNKNPKPDITYLTPDDSWFTRYWKASTNSFLGNFNFGYDHGDYISRIDLAQNHLEETNLNALYQDESVVGYNL